ncbi:MAG TPA: hypothetical protein VFM05_10745 [Candidatus Saccharimonadales bacterium]|nr:hypothetical protein [Candidatus Saccharimonadales bacterium]
MVSRTQTVFFIWLSAGLALNNAVQGKCQRVKKQSGNAYEVTLPLCWEHSLSGLVLT